MWEDVQEPDIADRPEELATSSYGPMKIAFRLGCHQISPVKQESTLCSGRRRYSKGNESITVYCIWSEHSTGLGASATSGTSWLDHCD
eukprot:12901369-Prorocentrum_lima.AAC.1